MTPNQTVHRLLCQAFDHIRRVGHETGSVVLFHLADLYYPVAIDLAMVEQGVLTHDDVLGRLRIRAQDKGVGPWLERVIAREQRWSSDEHDVSTDVLLYRLLAAALIEIRVEADRLQTYDIFRLADVFHDTPLKLAAVEQGATSYEEILEWLRYRAQLRGYEAWLEQAIENVFQPLTPIT